jgi:hypothetical protein
MKKLLFVVLFVILGSYFIPASWAVNQLSAKYSFFSYHGVNRFWWNAHIKKANVVLRGYRVFIGDIHWRYEWASIFSANTCVHFYSYDVLMQAEGRVCYDLVNNDFTIHDVDFFLSAEEVAAVSGVEVIGHFDGYIDEINVRNNEVALVQGNVVWKDAQWHNGEKWLSLGQILFTAMTNGEHIVVHGRDVDSPITVDLTALFKKQYIQSIVGSIDVSEASDASLRDSVDFFSSERKGQKYLVEHYFNRL